MESRRRAILMVSNQALLQTQSGMVRRIKKSPAGPLFCPSTSTCSHLTLLQQSNSSLAESLPPCLRFASIRASLCACSLGRLHQHLILHASQSLPVNWQTSITPSVAVSEHPTLPPTLMAPLVAGMSLFPASRIQSGSMDNVFVGAVRAGLDGRPSDGPTVRVAQHTGT